jgi:hypothetical protein
MDKEYKLNDFNDLMKLSNDQVERLCSELPRLVEYAKAVTGLVDVVAEAIEVDHKCELLSPITWIDDGQQNLSIQMVNDSDETQLEFSITKDQ